jgi:hypothetical protein
MFSPVRIAAPALLAAVALSGLTATAAQAAPARRMVSYDSSSPEARRLTGAGLTFVFSKSWMRQRIWAVRATAVPVGVIPEPVRDGDTVNALDDLMGEDRGTGTLYAIDPEKDEAKVMVQAFCPGSRKGWLSISPIAHRRDLRVHAFGDDPATGKPRLCSVMDFSYRGEWRMPNPNNSDITARVMRPDYVRTPGS